MAEMNRRRLPATAWIFVGLVVVVLLGAAFMLLAPTNETVDNAGGGQATTQQDSPEATPADRPRDPTEKANP